LSRTDESPPPVEQRFERERQIHDALAAEMDPSSMPPRESGLPVASLSQSMLSNTEGPIFENSILVSLGSIEGKRILDLGCGTGDLALRLLRRGAIVTGLDLSPGMVALAEERAAKFLPEAKADFVAAPAEATGLESGSFDWVVGKWVLHHTDVDAAGAEIHRVLKPGGGAIFVETSALNPLLMLARRHLVGRWGINQFGTPDEHPISKTDIEVLRRRYRGCKVDFPEFVFFIMLDRHLFSGRSPRLTRLLADADGFIKHHLPRLQRASYFLRLQLQA
jgi:ubiquinone/menaquinone biosynthesis C-methylase UbiE